MKKYIQLLIAISAACFLSSCEDEVPIPESLKTNSKLVLNAELKGNTQEIDFNLSRSIPLYNSGKNNNADEIEIAEISLTNDGKIIPITYYEKNDNNGWYINYQQFVVTLGQDYFLIPGKKYQLKVQTTKNEVIYGEATIPQYVPTEAKLYLDSTNDDGYYTYYTYKLEFQDKAGENNYYLTSYFYPSQGNQNSGNYNFEEILTDASKDGKLLITSEKGISFRQEYYLDQNGYSVNYNLFNDIGFKIKALDYHAYTYFSILKNYSGNDIFAEPLNMHSNVEGGLGIVCASNEQIVQIK